MGLLRPCPAHSPTGSLNDVDLALLGVHEGHQIHRRHIHPFGETPGIAHDSLAGVPEPLHHAIAHDRFLPPAHVLRESPRMIGPQINASAAREVLCRVDGRVKRDGLLQSIPAHRVAQRDLLGQRIRIEHLAAGEHTCTIKLIRTDGGVIHHRDQDLIGNDDLALGRLGKAQRVDLLPVSLHVIHGRHDRIAVLIEAPLAIKHPGRSGKEQPLVQGKILVRERKSECFIRLANRLVGLIEDGRPQGSIARRAHAHGRTQHMRRLVGAEDDRASTLLLIHRIQELVDHARVRAGREIQILWSQLDLVVAAAHAGVGTDAQRAELAAPGVLIAPLVEHLLQKIERGHEHDGALGVNRLRRPHLQQRLSGTASHHHGGAIGLGHARLNGGKSFRLMRGWGFFDQGHGLDCFTLRATIVSTRKESYKCLTSNTSKWNFRFSRWTDARSSTNGSPLPGQPRRSSTRSLAG